MKFRIFNSYGHLLLEFDFEEVMMEPGVKTIVTIPEDKFKEIGELLRESVSKGTIQYFGQHADNKFQFTPSPNMFINIKNNA